MSAVREETSVVVSRAELQSYREGLFFLVGNSRGGTTLLQSMLSSHSRITIPPETHYFIVLDRLKERFGEFIKPRDVRAVTDSLCRRGRFADFGVDPNDVAASFESQGGGYPELFLSFLGVYAKARGKRRCGEKTPRHIMKVLEISNIFPQSKFIALFRDPRAVVNSELKAEYGNPSTFVIARRWARYFDMNQRLLSTLPRERYMMIRYEDLLNHPRKKLKEICKFLDEKFENEMLEYPSRSGSECGFSSKETWKKTTFEPVNRDRIDAWRADLAVEQITIIERVVGSRLRHMGYEPISQQYSTSKYLISSALAKDIGSSARATLYRSIKKLYINTRALIGLNVPDRSHSYEHRKARRRRTNSVKLTLY